MRVTSSALPSRAAAPARAEAASDRGFGQVLTAETERAEARRAQDDQRDFPTGNEADAAPLMGRPGQPEPRTPAAQSEAPHAGAAPTEPGGEGTPGKSDDSEGAGHPRAEGPAEADPAPARALAASSATDPNRGHVTVDAAQVVQTAASTVAYSTRPEARAETRPDRPATPGRAAMSPAMGTVERPAAGAVERPAPGAVEPAPRVEATPARAEAAPAPEAPAPARAETAPAPEAEAPVRGDTARSEAPARGEAASAAAERKDGSPSSGGEQKSDSSGSQREGRPGAGQAARAAEDEGGESASFSARRNVSVDRVQSAPRRASAPEPSPAPAAEPAEPVVVTSAAPVTAGEAVAEAATPQAPVSRVEAPSPAAPVSTAADAAALAEKLSGHLDALRVSRGQVREMTLRLGDLGDVQVRMSLESARLSVVLEPGQAQAASLLRQGVAALAEGLQAKGFDGARIEVREAPQGEQAGERSGRGSEQRRDDAQEREAFAAAVGRRYRDGQSSGSQQGRLSLIA